MKKNKMKKTGLIATVCVAVAMSILLAKPVYAYDYSKSGAEQEGTVTIEAISSGNSVNGYSLSGGYRVTYSITKNDWNSFDGANGCDFYIGNQLSVSDGCHFVYKPNGVVWQQGALALGVIADGVSVGSCAPDGDGTVQVSFTVRDLSELPEYICYTYQPASGNYLHMSDSYGPNYHVWYYQHLKNAPVRNIGTIDTTAPNLSVDITAGGNTAYANGKLWGTKALIKATATDEQSRPGGIRFYKNGGEVHNCGNSANTTALIGQYMADSNAVYQISAYDRLGNTCSMQTVTVDCIDSSAPAISSFTASESAYCSSLDLTVSAADAGSGLHAEAYSFNNGAWTSNNRLTVTKNGLYTVRVRDAVGNISTQSIEIGNIDKSAPVITAFIKSTQNYCKTEELTVTAYDTGCGLHAEAYSFQNGEWTSCNKLEINENGSYIVRVRDKAGNIASESIVIDNIDSEAPALLAVKQAVGEEIEVENQIWSREKTIHIEAADDMSGLSKIEITDETGQGILLAEADNHSKKSLIFDTDAMPAGIYKITAYDMLGNSRQEQVEIDWIDNIPPTITAVIQTVLNDEKVRISVWAFDNKNGSGLPKEAYSFDGGITWQEDNFADVTQNGAYKLAVRDYMGLQGRITENVISFSDPNGKDDKNTDDKDTDRNDQNNSDDKNTGGDDQNNSDDKNTGGDNQNNSDDNGDTDNDSHNNSDDTGGAIHDNNNNGSTHIVPIGTPDSAKDVQKNKKRKRPTESPKSNQTEEDADSDTLNGNRTLDSTVNENSILEDKNKDTYVKEAIEQVFEDSMSERQTDVRQVREAASEKEKKVKRIAAIVLISILIAGLLALGAYFILASLYYSCILYAVDDKNHKKKLCRLPIRTFSDDWLVEVPDHKLGDFGNGRYMAVFRASFVKEGSSDYVVITIDRNRIREKLREEIEFKI